MTRGTRRRVLAAGALLVAGVLGGCIRRYPAPEAPVVPTTPYSALALYRGILPAVGDGDPLPRAAIRIAASDDAVFADAALVDGPEHPAITETWAGVLALLQIRPQQPVVLLADDAGVARACLELEVHASRVLLAVRPQDEALHPMKERRADDGLSEDRLEGAPLECPP